MIVFFMQILLGLFHRYLLTVWEEWKDRFFDLSAGL
jgi:hypothetical protein